MEFSDKHPFTHVIRGHTHVADVAEPNVAPLVLDFVIEGLEIGDSVSLLKQLLASFAKLSLVLLVQVLLCLQLDDVSGEELGEYPMATNQGPDVCWKRCTLLTRTYCLGAPTLN